ncbi:hypothetical protein [Rossellomorea sp. LJF3]|uniref:hypothetical protein n=1 Tax=Rossellomorea sp. LJF3 TaxID=3126099 RepID=UPI00300D9B4A
MLQRLLDHGINNSYFKIKPIKDIEKSCCQVSITEVIDYDDTKRYMIDTLNQSSITFQDPKSCDALKIIPASDRIDFIEFKGLDLFINNLSGTEVQVERQLTKQVNKFDFETKIKDSLFILDLITKIGSLEMTKKERDYFKEISKNYIIMVDVEIEKDPMKNMAFNLMYLSETSNFKEKLITYIQDTLTGIKERIEINKPILLSNKRIDSYYKELQSV